MAETAEMNADEVVALLRANPETVEDVAATETAREAPRKTVLDAIESVRRAAGASKVTLETRVSGRSDNVGSVVIGAALSRISNVKVDGEPDENVIVRQYQPGGREDLDETEIVIPDLAPRESVMVTLEVSDNG